MCEVGPLTPDQMFATGGCLAGEAVEQRSETHAPRWPGGDGGKCELTAEGAGATGPAVCCPRGQVGPVCTGAAVVLRKL